MRISRKGVLRALGLVALALLVQAQSGAVLVEASRNASDCVKICNAVKAECRDACQVDCGLIYTPGTPEFDACNAACQQDCSDESQECKAKCNVGKGPPSPTEP